MTWSHRRVVASPRRRIADRDSPSPWTTSTRCARPCGRGEWSCSTARWIGRGASGPRASAIRAVTSGRSRSRVVSAPRRNRRVGMHVTRTLLAAVLLVVAIVGVPLGRGRGRECRPPRDPRGTCRRRAGHRHGSPGHARPARDHPAADDVVRQAARRRCWVRRGSPAVPRRISGVASRRSRRGAGSHRRRLRRDHGRSVRPCCDAGIRRCADPSPGGGGGRPGRRPRRRGTGLLRVGGVPSVGRSGDAGHRSGPVQRPGPE